MFLTDSIQISPISLVIIEPVFIGPHSVKNFIRGVYVVHVTGVFRVNSNKQKGMNYLSEDTSLSLAFWIYKATNKHNFSIYQ